MFEPTTTFLSAANRCRSVAASFSLVLLSVAAFGCGSLTEDDEYHPPSSYEPPTYAASQSPGSGDGDDAGYGDDYDSGYGDDYYYGDDYDYGDDDVRALAGGPGGCSDTCRHANDDECDDGGPGADFDECSFGTDCGDCGPR